MRVRFKGDKGQFIRATTEVEKAIAHAATMAVRKTATAMRDAGRENIADAGFGSAWQRSLTVAMRPKRGDALNPWAWIHTSINFADVFETGRAISATHRSFLWLPLRNVPMWPGAVPPRQMSPKKFIQLVGPLRTIRRPGKPPMLGAVARVGRRGRVRIKGGIAGTWKVVPMFVGVPAVTIQKKFNVIGAMESAAGQMPEFYAQNLEYVSKK